MKVASIKRNTCSKQLVRADHFGQAFNLVLPDNSTKLRTVPGAICWILMIILISSYASYRMIMMSTFQLYSYTTENEQYHFD